MRSVGISTLRRLANIINEAIDEIEGVYAAADIPLPSLDAPFNPSDPAEALLHNPTVEGATLNIMAAAAQLSAMLASPAVSALNASHAFHISACLRAASEVNVVEVLREAGPAGLHANEIAAPSKTDPFVPARILRLLATHNIFREVTPNVFANNRISSVLDKGKPSKVLFEIRDERLLGTSGFAALLECSADHNMKGVAMLADTMLDPKEGELPFNRAYGTTESFWDWVHRPENVYQMQRFDIGMRGSTESTDAIHRGFNWSGLPTGGVLVDVGGGTGHISLAIAQKNPGLRVVVQDLEDTVKDSKIYWKANLPSHVDNQTVNFQVHDFHTPQPVHNAAVFMLRHVMHDWSDECMVKILRHLRDAAQPTTKLVVIDRILMSAARAPASHEETIPGSTRSSAPEPLLPNWGMAKASMYYFDVSMHCMLGGVERTLDHFVDVFAKGGWKLVRVHHPESRGNSHIVGVPDIINKAIDEIEGVYAAADLPLPSLDAPFNPVDPAEALLHNPTVEGATLNIMAAAAQLSATVASPLVSALNASHAYHIPACLRAASEVNVVEVLREVGPAGLHAKEIAAPSKTDPLLLARILRLLATHNIFREVTPNVFANNRISSMLDKGKPSKTLFKNRDERLTGTSGFAAYVEIFADDYMKGVAMLADTMLDPKEGELGFNRAYGTSESFFDWLHRPENLYQMQRFDIGMRGSSALESTDAIHKVVCPRGVFSLMWVEELATFLVQKNPGLSVVVQDLEDTIKDSKIYWKKNLPSHVESRMVDFQVHDFHTPQPILNADVFMLRHIVHNWSDERVVQILRHLRDAAQPTTKLVVIDRIPVSAARVPTSGEEPIPGSTRPSAPAPLLPNWGVGKATVYYFDVSVSASVVRMPREVSYSGRRCIA
ncbi:hypothetical protein MSAN_01700100 [Mycena sanguinolenta]|uniref:O-methyltransferase n=1 Tax=Mycena sanguinolenta TaxID=230812 RepID=A0A8H6XY44_9AGAR|nr:hypothetical protein MSAN_01700100 [Mycena sanguinolenta]